MTTVRELCRPEVIIARRGEPIRDAARRMRDAHVGCLVVVDDLDDGPSMPVGMLTDRDIVVRVLARSDRHLENVRVEDAMTADVFTAFEHERSETAVARMRELGIRRLPIIDDAGRLLGIVSLDDLLTHAAYELQQLAALIAREQRSERDIDRREPQVMRD